MPNIDSQLARHREARARLDRAVAAVPAARWSLPRAPGKWSPAQICEHLALADDAALRESETGVAMHQPMPPWKQHLLRWTVLRWIIVTGKFPPEAPAPRETRPAEPARDAASARARLADGGARIEAGVLARGGRLRFTHPYFGPLGTRAALGLLVRHLEHHARQLEAVAAARGGE